MNRRDRRRRGQTAGRRRKGKGSPYAIIVDSVTGERFVPVDDFVHFVRTREKPGITKLEVITRMRAVGWEFRYLEAKNPDPPHNVIGMDFFVAPAGWERAA